MRQNLEFETLGGGTVLVDTEKCGNCASKICAKICEGNFIMVHEEVPVLSLSLDEIKRGACTECLACELACVLQGLGAIRIVYPMPELDEFLRSLEGQEVKPVWRRC